MFKFDYEKEDEGLGWEITKIVYFTFKAIVITSLIVGLCISAQCRAEMKEACQIVGICD